VRSEEEKRDEVEKILCFIYFEWDKEITDELVSYWRENLRGKQISTAWIAAKLLVKKRTYGEPKLQDFVECYHAVANYSPAIAHTTYNPWTTPAEEIQREEWPELDEMMEQPEIKELIALCDVKLIA